MNYPLRCPKCNCYLELVEGEYNCNICKSIFHILKLSNGVERLAKVREFAGHFTSESTGASSTFDNLPLTINDYFVVVAIQKDFIVKILTLTKNLKYAQDAQEFFNKLYDKKNTFICKFEYPIKNAELKLQNEVTGTGNYNPCNPNPSNPLWVLSIEDNPAITTTI